MSLLVYERIKSFKYCTIFLVLALQGHHFNAKRTLDIYPTSFTCTVPQGIDAIELVNCSLTSAIEMRRSKYSKSRVHPAISLNARFAYDISDIKVQLNISLERGSRYDTYLSEELDLCELEFSKAKHPFVEYFRDELARVIQPAGICPLKKDILYKIENFMLTTKFVPIWVPTLKWKANLKYWFYGKHSADLVVTGIVETIFK